MPDIHEHIVDYYLYCPMCKNYHLDETKDPCNECLNSPTNTDSHRPIYFEEVDKK